MGTGSANEEGRRPRRTIIIETNKADAAEKPDAAAPRVRVSEAAPVRRASGHEGWIDLARAVCALGVVLLHCFSGFREGNPVPFVGEMRMVVWTALELVLGRFGVPVFFMLTGYLLLDDRRSFDVRKLGRYAARIAGLILIFGYPMNLLELVATGDGFTLGMLGDAFTMLLRGQSWGHMWYLYTLLGTYLLVPFLRAFAREADMRTHRTLLVVLGAATLLLPTAMRLFDIENAWSGYLSVGTAAPFYLLLGDFERRWQPSARSHVTAGAVAALVACLALAAAYIFVNKRASYALEDYANPLIAVWALGVFQAFRFGWGRIALSSAQARAVRFVSDNSLGLYILHPVLFNLLYKGLGISPITAFPGSFVLFWAAAAAFGLAGSWLLRKLPVLGRIL